MADPTVPVVQKNGYLGFGSFFTEPVEELVSKACQADYQPPTRPFCTDTFLEGGINLEGLSLGKSARRLFMVCDCVTCMVDDGTHLN